METINFRGRHKGSSYKSMAIILRLLMDGSKCFQEIVDGTKLHRNTVASNLKLLLAVEYVRKERKGRKVIYYAVDDERELAGCRLAFLEHYSTKKAWEEAEKTFIEDAKWEAKVTLYWIEKAKEYKDEIAELSRKIPNLERYQLHEIIEYAREHRKTKQEAKKRGLRLPSENVEIKDAKSVVESLIDFERDHPQIIEALKICAALRKKNRFLPPKGSILLVYPA
jgi:DNA-binding transcriptional ArsR family regulator